MKNALPSFSNRPILAYIIEVDGKPEFNTHAYHMDDENNMVYDEIPIGIIPESCGAKLEYDEDKDKTYCVVNGYIFEEYAPVAVEILERENECPVSVELSVRELSFDADKKVLNIDDFFFSGVTLLGKTEDGEKVMPGMSGSNIKLADFSVENNSFVFDKQNLINEITTAVIEQLSDNKNQRKEETSVDLNEMNEVTEEEVKVTEEETTEEETPAVDEETADVTPEVVDEEFTEEDSEVKDEEVSEEKSEEDSEEDADEVEEEVEEENKISYSITYGETTKDFSVSLQEKIYALSTLVNDTYSEIDGAWYEVTVYDEEKYVVMHDYWNGKHYRQSYAVKKDVYSLKGDRVEVYATFLTTDEIKKLDDMKSNYSEISDKLAKYESEPEKMNILNSDDYANIADTTECVEFKKEENHFDMSVDEVRAKADEMLLNFAKSGNLNFETNNGKKTVEVKHFASKDNGKTGRYGKLFRK